MVKQKNTIEAPLLTIVTPPSLKFTTTGPKIFLAGSICGGTAPDWQKDAIAYLDTRWPQEPISIYNPRREDEFLPEMESENSAWSISMFGFMDYIVLHLTGDSGSPISTFELGVFVSDPRLYLSVDDSYSRKEIIEIHYACFGTKSSYDSFQSSIDAILDDWSQKSKIKTV